MPAYLLLGPEHGKKKEFIEKKSTAFVRQAGLPFQTYRFYIGQDETESYLGTLLNPSLFGDLQILTVADAEQLKGKAAKETARYLENPSETNLLFLCSDETSSSKIDKSVAAAFKKEETVVFWELFESDKRSWILSFFLARKMKITPEAVSGLLETVSNDTEELRAVCSRLADFKGSGSEITVEDWEKFIYHSKEENVFTLFEKIVGQRFGSAVEAERKILQSGQANPISLTAGLTWQFRRLLKIHLLTDEGESLDSACERENIRGKRNRKLYADAVKVFGRKEVENCLILLNNTDSLLKSGAVFSGDILSDILIYRLMIGKGSVTDLFPSCEVPD